MTGLKIQLSLHHCEELRSNWKGRHPSADDCGDRPHKTFKHFAGAARGIRTPDPVITNDVLYQLSYCGEDQAGRGT
jgi:hypothetical protein